MTSGNGDQPDVDAETSSKDEAEIQRLQELADEEYGD